MLRRSASNPLARRSAVSILRCSEGINKRGVHSHQAHRQRCRCKTCGKQFDDLTGTIFEGHHLPLKVWVLCLYFMGLNLSNEQIAADLDLSPSEVQLLTRAIAPRDRGKKSL